MDVARRLMLETAQADTMLSSEHRHRYEFAAALCAGRRVLDLGCGSGDGAAILAGPAGRVTGVDRDAAALALAQTSVGKDAANLDFEVAEPLAFLSQGVAQRFDAIVCFNRFEQRAQLEQALALLCGYAQDGLRIIISIPNGALLDGPDRRKAAAVGYDEALRLFEPFPGSVMIPQYLAEGSLIVPPVALDSEVQVRLQDRDEPEYANYFLFCINFDAGEVQRAHHGRLQLSASPAFNRWAGEMKRGESALRRENARLARARLGKASSAAAAALAGLSHREARIAELEHRCAIAEARVIDLEAELGAVEKPPRPMVNPAPALDVIAEAAAQPPELPEELAPGEDPNSWEQRRRRAAKFLIPWIEQTVPLAGKTVLEYGCGNAAVSCAFAESAGRVIGVDIDADWIELGNHEIGRRGIENVELELHPVESILDAVAARKGEIDVFLCYAVLEHLTIKERLDLLRLAKEVVNPDGAIVVCEAPNRLIYFDHHTAQMPFFHLLPEELALDYYERSNRVDFREAIDQAARAGREAGREAIVRWGRGVSFHEFEVVFGDLSRHVIASNYDELLFAERPIHPDEVILARFLDRWRPDLAPVWSRYWLDLILSPRPVAKRSRFLRPWTVETIASRNVGWTRSESLLLAGPQASLPVTLPHPTSRVVVGCVTHDWTPVAVVVHPEGLETRLPKIIHAKPHHPAYRSFDLPAPTQRFTLEVSRECHLVFIGYDA